MQLAKLEAYLSRFDAQNTAHREMAVRAFTAQSPRKQAMIDRLCVKFFGMPFLATQTGAMSLTPGTVIGGVIVLMVIAAAVPLALTTIFAVDGEADGWDAGTVLMWGLIGLAVVGGLIISILKLFGINVGKG